MLPTTWQQAALYVLVPVIVAVFGYMTGRVKRDRENAYMDQLQEDMAVLRARVDMLERDRRSDSDYIILLRKHIEDEVGPPPPPYPRDTPPSFPREL